MLGSNPFNELAKNGNSGLLADEDEKDRDDDNNEESN